jgi:hypothetical protein
LYTVGNVKDKLSYLLVFALQYCKHGQRNKPVQADTVKTVLTAVGTGISKLGVQNPCKLSGSDKFYPLLTDFIRSLNKEDDPAGRVYPANLTILRALLDALDVEHPKYGTLNIHIILLCVVSFY